MTAISFLVHLIARLITAVWLYGTDEHDADPHEKSAQIYQQDITVAMFIAEHYFRLYAWSYIADFKCFPLRIDLYGKQYPPRDALLAD